MKHIGKYLALLFLLFTPMLWTVDGFDVFTLSHSNYKDAFHSLQPGWSSQTLYQTRPLEPSSICETSANEVLLLDKGLSEILELHTNGSVSTYLSLGEIYLNAICFQPNADRVIGIGWRTFYTLNRTTIEVIKEHPSNIDFFTIVVDPTDDSMYTGHWENDSSIFHFDANGEYISTMRNGILGCGQVAVDGPSHLLYYSETFPGRITQLNLTTNTTSVLALGIAIPGSGEGISIATDPSGDLFYLVAEGIEKGFYKYNGTAFESIMAPILGIGSMSWSQKFDSFLATPGYGGCVVQYDPDASEPIVLTPTVNTRPIIETSDGLLLLGIRNTIYKVESGTFSEFITNLPFRCGSLVLDGDEKIYASLVNDSVSILRINPDGTNTTWFRKDMKTFPQSLVYDSKNDWMILMTYDLGNRTLDLWRLPIDNPVDYSKIASIENATWGDFTVDRSGNIFVLERGENILYKIPDSSDQLQILKTNVVEHAYLTYPHIAYSTDADAIIMCRNDDLQAWPVGGGSSYILGVTAAGIDHEGLFENPDGDLVGTHAGQIFKLHYDSTTGTTTPTEPTTPYEPPESFPMGIVAIGVGAVIVGIVTVYYVKSRK